LAIIREINIISELKKKGDFREKTVQFEETDLRDPIVCDLA
jgi:hypothetical protein